jgi:hypothetical protein
MISKILDLSKIGPKIPDNLKEFDPSYVTRYAITAELIKVASGKDVKKVKVLDVGGYNGAIRDFLPGCDITILDMVDDEVTEKYVKASGADIPFKDNSFDIVISCDTLEHIPADKRDKFIQELIRVSKNNVFLCAPFGSESVESAEKVSDTFYESMTGESYVWLKEHKEFVLPKKEWLRKQLQNEQINFDEFDHSSIPLWTLLLTGSFFLSGNIAPVDKSLYDRLRKGSEEYLKSVTFVDFPKEGYRTFFVISKLYKPTVELPKYSKEKIDSYFNKAVASIGGVIRDLDSGYGSVQKEVLILRDKINDYESQKSELQEEMNALRVRYEELINSKTYKLAKKIRDTKHRIIK